jgi:hypothetical protein
MSHFQEIKNLYNATQNLWKAVNTITNISKPAYTALLQIEDTGKKLLWNAYTYGVSANTSVKFRNKIDNLAETLIQNIYNNPEVSSAAVRPMRELRTALDRYIPTDVPAQVKSKKPAEKVEPHEGAAFSGRSAEPEGDVQIGEIEQPQANTPAQEVKYTNPQDVIKNVLGRNVITFYSMPKAKWDLDKDLYESQGLHFVDGLGIIAPNEINLANKIVNEKWIKTPNYGFVSPKEYSILKFKGYL